MPLEWLVIRGIASNQVRNGTLLRCMIVPAVTDVWRWQPEHSQVKRLVSSSQPLQTPQAGQTNPSGQRNCARCRAHAASSGNRLSKSVRDIGLSCFHRLFMVRTKDERTKPRDGKQTKSPPQHKTIWRRA